VLLSPELIHLIITSAFSLLIGLEIKTYNLKAGESAQKFIFGTARTYTFIGIIGYISYKLEPVHFTVYSIILASFSLLFALLYYQKLKEDIFNSLYSVL